MRIDDDREAAKPFPLHPAVLHPAPVRGASNRFPHAAARGPLPLELHASLPPQAGALRPEIFFPRCCHKGCVFPAQPSGQGECLYHRRQALEPDCFESRQPSFLLLDQAKFGLPDSEPDDGRVRDRHRLAEERVRFMLGDAA